MTATKSTMVSCRKDMERCGFEEKLSLSMKNERD